MLTHWDRDEIDAILQAKFSDVFCWMKMHWLRLKFHWIILPRVQLTIFQHLTVQPRRTGVTLADAVTRSKRRSSFETAIILSFFIVRVKTNIGITNIGIIGDIFLARSGFGFSFHDHHKSTINPLQILLSLFMFKKGWLPEQVLRTISREKIEYRGHISRSYMTSRNTDFQEFRSMVKVIGLPDDLGPNMAVHQFLA